MSPFASPQTVSGIAFGVSTYPDTANAGTIWVDDLELMGGSAAGEGSVPAPAEEQGTEIETMDEERGL